jgi:hypothetical protein
MNEDERGITPANVTAVTVAPLDGGAADQRCACSRISGSDEPFVHG